MDTSSGAWTPPPTYQLDLPDGRVLRYCTYGPEDGRPVVLHNGTPGSRLLGPKADAVAARGGVRLVLSDRPGYGGSTPQPGRSVAAVAPDTAALADALGWERFAVMGGSGGGPHALACAALLPGRVTSCLAYVCPAPLDATGLDFYAGMSPGNVEEFEAAERGADAYRPIVERLAGESVEAVRSGGLPFGDGYDLPESDLAEMRKRQHESPGWAERAVAANGPDAVEGWIDDGVAFVRPWGFDLTAPYAMPVSIWSGPDDVLVPSGHADWLATHLPGVEVHALPGGHMQDDDTTVAMYRWLT